MEFDLYNMTSIWLFTSMLAVVCEKTIILWVFTTAPKIFPVRIMLFVWSSFNNEQHTYRCVGVNEDGASENLTYVTNFIIYDFISAM